MIIGCYSDAHFSISSSILNRLNGYKYSARLDYLINSFKWMYNEFKKNNVNLIINAGDLTDSDLLHAEENSALYEALSYNPGIPELYILGNHEIKNKNSSISSVSILNGYPNIEIYNKVVLLKKDDCDLILVPYMVNKDDYDQVYKILDKCDSNVPCYIFSHMSYIGENYNNYIETEGLDKIRLTSMYENINGIFNGHIHNVKDDGLYHQIGSLMGGSFGDNYDQGYPGIIILDTSSGEFKRIINPHAVLFFKLYGSSLGDITKLLNKLRKANYKCLRIEVPSNIKDEISEYIDQNKDKYKILEYRIKSKYEKSLVLNEVSESISSYHNPYEALKGFLDTQSELPYPKDEMIKFLGTYIGG